GPLRPALRRGCRWWAASGPDTQSTRETRRTPLRLSRQGPLLSALDEGWARMFAGTKPRRSRATRGRANGTARRTAIADCRHFGCRTAGTALGAPDLAHVRDLHGIPHVHREGSETRTRAGRRRSARRARGTPLAAHGRGL